MHLVPRVPGTGGTARECGEGQGQRAARSQTAGLKTVQSWSGLSGDLQSLRTGF